MEDKAQEFYKKSNAQKIIKKELDSFAMWSFLLSIAPILILFPIINFIIFIIWPILLIISITLGFLSIGRIKKNKLKYGKGFAISGIIISFILIILSLIFLYYLQNFN